MPVTHLVNVILRPGIQSIQVQYKYQSAEVWTNYNNGQRIPGGVEVKFTVTTYSNFTLTEWKAWYADEYDDTVELTLTGITGESSWTFTLPSADVYIRCEAQYQGTDFSNVEIFTEAVANRKVYVLSYLTVNQFLDSVNATLLSLGYPVLSSNIESIIEDNFINNALQTWYIYHIKSYKRIELWRELYRDTHTSFNEGTTAAVIASAWMSPNNSSDAFGNWNNITLSFALEISTQFPLIAGYGISGGATENVLGYSFPSVGTYSLDAPSAEVSTIRYIMSPENSGEIDASAPSEFEVGTTEFTFNWRIKAGYSLKRITPFAVGDGPLEDDVLYSSVYDGETRTYTITVQQIPSWATGVRVLIECINQNDPNVGGNSGTGGGNGTFDDSSDSVPIEAMPSISAADAGLITLFKPTLSELKELGAYLWTNITDFIENLQKIFSNPMDVIIALNILPGSPPTNSARNIRLGLWETNISMAPVQSQWYEIDFGNVRISEYWGSALDYSPNTKIHAMLPFIGSVQLDTDDIMDKVVGLVYRIDLLSGHLVAIMTVNDNVLYQFTGECAVAVPLTGADWSRVYGAIAGTLGTIAVGVAGAAAAGAAASGISQTASIAQTAAAQADFDYMAGNIATMEHRQLQAAAAQAVGRKNAGEAAKAAGAAALASNTVNQIMGGKLQIAHSGTISGSAGLLGNRTPYIYIEYPNQSMAENYKKFYGYPSNMYANLGGLQGYTQCYQVLLTGVNGTDGEIAEILNLLKEGVYL